MKQSLQTYPGGIFKLRVMSTLFLFISNFGNAIQLPICTHNLAEFDDKSPSIPYAKLEVPEGLVPNEQYFVYTIKWAAPMGTEPRLVAIMNSDGEGKAKIEIPNIEYDDYALMFRLSPAPTDFSNNWTVPCQ